MENGMPIMISSDEDLMIHETVSFIHFNDSLHRYVKMNTLLADMRLQDVAVRTRTVNLLYNKKYCTRSMYYVRVPVDS